VAVSSFRHGRACHGHPRLCCAHMKTWMAGARPSAGPAITRRGNGNRRAERMRALKILVVVMGVMLVGGTAALIAAIIDRASRHTPTAGAPPVPRGFEHAAVALPPGARV